MPDGAITVSRRTLCAMAAYVAMAYIVSARPQRPANPAVSTIRGPAVFEAEAETTDLVGEPLDDRIAERWSHIRQSWSQTTFYLFDPESWR
jgi:hypothetical protein